MSIRKIVITASVAFILSGTAAIACVNANVCGTPINVKTPGQTGGCGVFQLREDTNNPRIRYYINRNDNLSFPHAFPALIAAAMNNTVIEFNTGGDPNTNCNGVGTYVSGSGFWTAVLP